MIPYSLAQLREILSAKLIGDERKIVRNVVYDSRGIIQTREAIFIAFRGKTQDGHNYIEEAYAKGIRNFMVEKLPTNFPKEANFLEVKDTKAALHKWATYHRESMAVPTIGITGSNGKTIVKEWLYQLLLKNYHVMRSPKSYNSQIGVPLSVLEIDASDEIAIIEMGISQPGEMEKISDIVQPEIGILTNIGTAHSAFFKDRKEHINEKIRLFEHAEVVVYPYDDVEVRDLIESKFRHKKLIGFGKSEGATVQLTRTTQKFEEIIYNDEAYEISIPSKNEASIQNALICFAVITQLDLNLKDLILGFEKLSDIAMRLEVKEGDFNSVIINDTFNADLTSVPIALNVLNKQKKNKKTLILTDILQNRVSGEELYSQLAGWVNSYPIQKVLLIGTEISQYARKFKSVRNTFSSTDAFLNAVDTSDFYDEAILIKGARMFSLEKISKAFEKKSHDTILEIDLSNLIENVNYYKSKLSQGTKLMCMVKAFGYGTGGFEVAQALIGQHVDYLGVAYADEGAELRKKGITTPIMVMNPEQSSYDAIIDNKLETEIYSLRVLEKFTLKLIEKKISQAYPIHIKLNTGMNRLGFKPNEISELVQQLADNPYVKVVSIFSHLATSDVPEETEFVHYQAKEFEQMYDKLCHNLGYKPIRHLLNSAGITHFNQYQYEMVRLGIGMYGVSFDANEQMYLKNVVTFKTVISQITELKEGDSVSYGRKFRADHPMRIATLPVGYADGVKRILGNQNGDVSIHGKLAPILGTVCMDMIMVDVTNIECEEGDEVIIFGDKPTLSEIAEKANSITYEILTSISSRVKRIYIQ